MYKFLLNFWGYRLPDEAMETSQYFIKFLAIALCLSLSCDKVNLKRDNSQAKATLTLQNLSKFTYVAIGHTGPYEDFDLLKEEFLYEIKKQQIISTGPPFVVYYNNPDNTKPNDLQWEIGMPTAEGTMVKEPLILKNWIYEKIAKVEKDEETPITRNIYPLIFEQISEKNLTYQGPTAVRILNDIENDTSQTGKTEIWIPLVDNTHLAD
jgi:predicted transcriptional regulator YdeE